MIEITLNKFEIEFSPENEQQEIIQNVRMILSTMFFETPYHREFGLNTTYLDAPIQRSQILSKADIIKQIKKYEPRANVKYVTFDGNGLEGKTTPKVGIELND